MWRHLMNDNNNNSSCSFTASETEQNTYNCKTPLTDALVNTKFWFLMKITDSNVNESTEKLKVSENH